MASDNPEAEAPSHAPAGLSMTPRGILLKVIGPGILLAGAAIGVSHLVQATRAGAEFGFLLLPVLLLACATKYPFLEFGPRYAAATGETLIEGYRRLGAWALWICLLVTAGSMFIILAAVTSVTAALASPLMELVLPSERAGALSPSSWSALILTACMLLLVIGRYPALDRTMKGIMSVLLLSTLAAVVISLTASGSASTAKSAATDTTSPLWTMGTFAFLLAFMGWMPIPIDSAIWHSIWTGERSRQTGHRPTLRQARTDFHVGYLLATGVGILFLVLGAMVMHGRGIDFANGAAFARQFIGMYGETLGRWAIPIIGVAAFTTMFSTTLVVLDAFPRVMQRLVATLRGRPASGPKARRDLALWVVVHAISAWLILIALDTRHFLYLVDLATTLSFLTAPVLAFINYRVVTGAHMPPAARPGRAMRLFSVTSIVFLTLFSGAYLIWRLTAG